MKAVVYECPQKVSVKEVPEPKIFHPKDAILRVTTSGICGSDLHMYDGRTNVPPGTVLGHEIMGIIEEVGPGVRSIKKGDRVVLPFNIACGYCSNCTRGFTNACLTTNPDAAGAAYGYAGMGPYRGGQAEYVLVPFADFNCIKLPGVPHDEWEDDFLLLSDIFPTGYHATHLANIIPGATVAIYGAGPVGLLAAHSAIIQGASQVFIVDQSDVRLAVAKDFGAIPINFKHGDPAEQIRMRRKDNYLVMGSFLPGEEKMLGVMCGIDAVGYQAKSFSDPAKDDPNAVIDNLIGVVNPTGAIGVIGVYMPYDPGAPTEEARQGILNIPFGQFWSKGLSLGTGQTPVKRLSLLLRDMIIAGHARPSKIVSHRITIDEAPRAYGLFDHRGTREGEGYTKIIIKFR